MDPRSKIPVLALLGLSCTECDAEPDPIVGEWQAVDIDGLAFPMLESTAGYDFRVGWQLRIAPDHSGVMAYYRDSEETDIRYHSEYYSDFTLDVADAPKYRFTVEGDLTDAVSGGDYDDSESNATATITSMGDDGDYGGTYGGDTTDTGYGTGALDDEVMAFDEFEPELSAAPRPSRAGTLILDCELAAGALTCARKLGPGDDGDLATWRFEKRADPK